MTIQSLFNRFTRSKSAARPFTVVVQPDALYFSPINGTDVVHSVPLTDASWQVALINGLKTLNLKAKKIEINVILHSNLYQTYQIEKPTLQQEEWAVGLPFLLKDLITEKVTELVADGVPLPYDDKIQVYATRKRMVLDLNHELQAIGFILGKVIPEDIIWGRSADKLDDFFLLQRSKNGSFKFLAFVGQQCCFQRTIRNVIAPITEVASAALQFDGLALELQRSIDYLSSQLRNSSLHQLKICCDEEDQALLCSALNERLNVNVSLLENKKTTSSQVLIDKSRDLNDNVVNLYPKHFKPKKPFFSLARIVGLWSFLAIMLLLLFTYYKYQDDRYQQQLQSLNANTVTLDSELATLKQRMAKHLPSANKIAAAERLKIEIVTKQDSTIALSEFDAFQQEGYSDIMKSLAVVARDDISLSVIDIGPSRFNLQGVAREAKVVPNWINQFQTELSLVGRSFEKLKIGRNEHDVVTFELTTKKETK